MAENTENTVKIRLLSTLKEAVGKETITVTARTWREALIVARTLHKELSRVVNDKGEPVPGYIVFVDGIDYRLAGDSPAKEVSIVPVVHGGSRKTEFVMITWEDVERTSQDVAYKIKQSGFMPDIVVGILRGGVVPARIISDILGVDDIAVIEVKLYKDFTTRGARPYLRQPVTIPLKGRRVILVDDVSDTGLTLELALQAINLYMPTAVKTATLYIKPWTKIVPDYYSEITDKWIVFPWEKWESGKYEPV
ncbi:MAG: hypothetical protein F7C07_03315 [Desulfurococcales archaeon]|nr:hypothetical protein [Desulfurococcales archaeon]